jgi:hypothetical protein
MILNDKDATARLSSPMNLINRLKESSSRKSAMSLFGIGRKNESNISTTSVPIVAEVQSGLVSNEELVSKAAFNPFQKPSETHQQPILDNILENNESQIKLGLAHDSALSLLNNSIAQLAAKLDDVRADRLPSVIAAASKTVESIRKERAENSKTNKDREVHYHFYTPEQRKLDTYEVIDVA